MKNKSYTKSGPGRTHEHRPSGRTIVSREKVGNKLARKIARKCLTLRG